MAAWVCFTYNHLKAINTNKVVNGHKTVEMCASLYVKVHIYEKNWFWRCVQTEHEASFIVNNKSGVIANKVNVRMWMVTLHFHPTNIRSVSHLLLWKPVRICPGWCKLRRRGIRASWKYLNWSKIKFTLILGPNTSTSYMYKDERNNKRHTHTCLLAQS